MSKGIVWIASYPKSGNTWLRAIIASLVDNGQPPNLNALSRTCPNGANRVWIEKHLQVPTDDFTPEELRAARIAAYGAFAQGRQGSPCLKVHDQYDPALFSEEFSAGAVYVVRDPRDVALSWADHMDVSIDEAIRRMAQRNFCVGQGINAYRPQTQQILGSWSDHVLGWIGNARLPTLVLKYENMLVDLPDAIARVASFLNMDASAEVISKAASACRFARFRAFEEAHGFSERWDHQQAFFRKGRSGAWRETLTPEQHERLLASHRTAMTRLGC